MADGASRAVDFVLELQLPGGQIGWRRDADGTSAAARRC